MKNKVEKLYRKDQLQFTTSFPGHAQTTCPSLSFIFMGYL